MEPSIVMAILNFLIGLHPAVPLVLAGLGGLVVLAQAYVLITPRKDDDAWYAKLEGMPIIGVLLIAMKSFAPIQRK